MNAQQIVSELRNRLRNHRGHYSQMCKCTGLDLSWLSKFANSRIENPTIKQLEKLDRELTRWEEGFHGQKRMQVVLEDITPNAEEKIARFAAICYNSDTSSEANARRVKHLMKVGHLATLRFASATFRVSGISRACSHQLVRHPHLSYLQRSQRYVNEGEGKFIIPPEIRNTEQEEVYLDFINQSFSTYDRLVTLGAKKEDARFVLPNAAATEMYITGNLQAWKEACILRTSPKAQWEIREVFTQIQDILRDECPNVFAETS